MSYKTIAVEDEVKEEFDEWQYESRSRNQTQALRKLLQIARDQKEGVEA